MNFYSILGRVVNQQGLPLPNILVIIATGSHETPDICAVTDTHGEFSFTDLHPGKYQLLLTTENAKRHITVQIKARNRKIKIIMRLTP